MSRIVIVILIYHCHRPIGLVYCYSVSFEAARSIVILIYDSNFGSSTSSTSTNLTINVT
jgi:hypothetical protein